MTEAQAPRSVRAESSDAVGAPCESLVRCQGSVVTSTVVCSGTAEEYRGAEGGAGMKSAATRDGEDVVTTRAAAGARVQEAFERHVGAAVQVAFERHVGAAVQVEGDESAESRWREPARCTHHVDLDAGAVTLKQTGTGGEARGGRRRAPPRTLADATWLRKDAAAIAAEPPPSTCGEATQPMQVVRRQRTAPRRLKGAGGAGSGDDGGGTADTARLASAAPLKPTTAQPPSPRPPLATRRAEGAVAAAAAAAAPRWRPPSTSMLGRSERPPAPPLPPPPPPLPPASHRNDKENTGGHNGGHNAARLSQHASDRGALLDQIKTMNYTLKSVVAAKEKASSNSAAPPPDSRQRVKASAVHGPSPGTLMRSAVVYEMEARRSHLRQGIESETDDDWE
jgi:hypothetical protein